MLADMLRNPARYRKFYLAVVGAVVTGAQAFGLPLAEDFSDKAVAIFDAAVALLILAVPNKK